MGIEGFEGWKLSTHVARKAPKRRDTEIIKRLIEIMENREASFDEILSRMPPLLPHPPDAQFRHYVSNAPTVAQK